MFKQSSAGRSFFLVSTLSAATVLLAACGGGGKIPKPSKPSKPSKPPTTQTPPAVAPTPPTPTPPTPTPPTPTPPTPTPPTTVPPTTTSPVIVPDPVQPVPANPTPSNPPTAEAKPYGQNGANYKLTFSEEFDKGFNRDVWNDAIWYEKSNATKNYTVENGVLKIWPQRDANGKFVNRTVDTDGKYYQTYGYFEIDAKLPKGKGTWPAFWLFNHIDNRRPEIDVMEAYAGGAAPWGFNKNGVAHPQAYAPTVWKGDNPGNESNSGSRQYDTGMDLSAGFHTYAVKWEPNKQTFYFDGKEVLTVNVTMRDPMYLLLDLWYGSASGTPDDSTPQGKANSFEVNYVRAWQFK